MKYCSNYESPALSVSDVEVENGFAATGDIESGFSILPPEFEYGGIF